MSCLVRSTILTTMALSVNCEVFRLIELPCPPQVLLEPVTESLPQLLVQTVCYVIGREAGLIILTPIYLFSATLSAISICKASLYLAWRVLLCGSWSKVGHGHARG